MEKNDIFFNTKEEFSGSDLTFILSLCEKLFPAPKTAYITQAKDVKEIPIVSYLDENVLKAFDRNKYGIGYESEYENPSIRITKQEGKGFISIPLIKEDEYHLTKKMVLELIENLDLKELSVSPVNFRSFNRRYRKNQRTADFPGLYWLQYYGAEEFKRQGGKAILDNPYIEAQLIKDGVFIQVGDSPYDVHTTEGEERMIKANAAMPPVRND